MTIMERIMNILKFLNRSRVDIDRIRRVIEKHGWYWCDTENPTDNIVKTIDIIHVNYRMHKKSRLDNPLKDFYEKRVCSLEQYIEGHLGKVIKSLDRAKEKRDKLHHRVQKLESQLNACVELLHSIKDSPNNNYIRTKVNRLLEKNPDWKDNES